MYTEIQRTNVTESQFVAACRRALRKNGMGEWAGQIRTGFNPDGDTNWHSVDENGRGYTFCYEYGDGFGHLYVAEF